MICPVCLKPSSHRREYKMWTSAEFDRMDEVLKFLNFQNLTEDNCDIICTPLGKWVVFYRTKEKDHEII